MQFILFRHCIQGQAEFLYQRGAEQRLTGEIIVPLENENLNFRGKAVISHGGS